MEKLKEIAHISGKAGLYKIVKPTRTGVIVETLDAKKEKSVVGSNAKVSVLNEISVFMEEHQDSSKPLAEILSSMNAKYTDGLDFVPKELSEQKLTEKFLEIEPNFDRERVYPSDIKKIFSWFGILKSNMAEIFVEEKAIAEEVAEVAEEKVTEKPVSKAKKKA
ncbi:MAG: DUF5606 domain-containing protein [Bacteroidota bacterium]